MLNKKYFEQVLERKIQSVMISEKMIVDKIEMVEEGLKTLIMIHMVKLESRMRSWEDRALAPYINTEVEIVPSRHE